MDGVNEPDENGKISNLLDPDEEKQTFGRKSQNWPNLRDENSIFIRMLKFLEGTSMFQECRKWYNDS
ncbi:hypothetical protein Hanom_Chr17g01539761 [Helianthus anomalus]